MTKNKIEKERRFLLKRLPKLDYESRIEIVQFYIDGYRYRRSFDCTKNRAKYEKIKKISLGIGINSEEEIEEIPYQVFNELRRFGDREISKVRCIIENANHTFEIDVFYDMSLVILEIENVDIDKVIGFPPKIEDEILMEITENKNFSNYELAK